MHLASAFGDEFNNIPDSRHLFFMGNDYSTSFFKIELNNLLQNHTILLQQRSVYIFNDL
jgi:hypothetical protein